MPPPPEEAEPSGDPTALGSEPNVFAQLDDNCEEDPRGTTDYPVPASLGTGLVYDARYLLLGRSRVDHEEPVLVESQLASYQQKGFRPVQLDVKPFWDADLDVMRWDLPEYFPTLIADDHANHLVEVVRDLTMTELVDDFDARSTEGGWRPLSVVPYMVDVDGSQRYAAIWVRDGWSGNWAAFLGNTAEEIEDWNTEWAPQGYRPISIEATTIWDDVEEEYRRLFTMVAVRDAIGDQGTWWASMDLEGDVDFQNDIVDKAIQGLVPFYVSTSHTVPEIVHTEASFNVIYVPRPPVVNQQQTLEVVALAGMTDSDLHEENQLRRAQGYHLVSLASYRDDGDIDDKLYVGIWHKYRRDLWIETVVGDISTEGEDFQPLEDAIRNIMEERDGRTTNIPAAQLAVMRGDELVLSRAYTRAPIAYAPITTGTPLMAASITKPVTAIATVRAFGVAGLDDDLMDLVPEPQLPGGTKPIGISVRHALQHKSGWDVRASALGVKDFIGENRLPNSQDWLEYMAQQEDNDMTGPAPQDYYYSNFGYEMLALALKEDAGIEPDDPDNEYETVLMAGEIFDEVGMCKTRYKRQGLVDGDGAPWPDPEPEYGSCIGQDPCRNLADRRYYLTEDDHPYFDDLEHDELSNPAFFQPSALDDSVPAPPYLRRITYGGGNAVQAFIGSGSLVSTAEDLVRMLASFRPHFIDSDPTVLLTSQEAWAMFPKAITPGGGGDDCEIPGRVYTEGTVSGGAGSIARCYGLGWFVGNDGSTSTDVWNHGGDVEGAVTMLLYHPETDTTVAVLFARHPFAAIHFGDELDEAILDEIASSGFAPPQFEPLSIDDEGYLPNGYPGW